jgi:histidinol-phosphate phosphatase family protein
MYIMIGLPGSGKSTKAKEVAARIPRSTVHSRDEKGGAISDLLKPVEADIVAGKTVIVDNTNLTVAGRRPFIDLAKRLGIKVHAVYIKSPMEDCQIRVLRRMADATGGIIYMTGKGPTKHPHIFPPAVLFAARKAEEAPKKEEGFDSVIEIAAPVPSWPFPEFSRKALFLDIDGTVRATEHLPNKYPVGEEDVTLLHPAEKMRCLLDVYRHHGYQLIGVSNQSGIAKGTVTEEAVQRTMLRTRELLGYTEEEFPVLYCPHRAAPVSCYCRKPQSGLGVQAILKYKLNPEACIMVGDQKTDETFATRLKIPFVSVTDFWKDMA